MTKPRKRKQNNSDKSQSSIFDFGDSLSSEKQSFQIQPPIAHENHIGDNLLKQIVYIEDSKLLKEEEEEEECDDNENDLRSEQIIISKDNYPSISMCDNPDQFNQSIDTFSRCNHLSKNLFNQCIYQIRQSFFGKIDTNSDGSKVPEKEKELRIKIRSELNKFNKKRTKNGKGFNYKNTVYKLLDKYFKHGSKDRIEKARDNDNYSWSVQAAQQIIDMAVEAWYDYDLALDDWTNHPEHRSDYTGKPGIVGYRNGLEYISVFTNQQCNIETKNVLIEESLKEERIRHIKKNFITFPDHLNIKPIETRLDSGTDIREVRIIPLIKKGYYKVEAVYKKVIDRIKIGKELNLDPNRIIGIDTGQENVVTVADNIGGSPIIIKGGVLLSINQWFDKIGAKYYGVYYRQQKHKGSESKGIPILMGSKMQKLSLDRSYKVLDILHKISRYIINHCIENRIGTIVWGRNPGWKQNINIGKRNNQKFTKIPHYLLFKMLKYKAEEIGIRVIDIEESHTSKCSFLDSEPVGHKEKGQYVGKRIKRGLFRSSLGIILNADVNAAYNMIRKVFPEAFKSIGIVDVVLHPERLSIKDLLSRPNSIG